MPVTNTVGCSRFAARNAVSSRSVHDARGRIDSLVSVQVRTGHTGSGQRHTRFTHTIVTSRPPEGRSRTHVGRRSCNTATIPHTRQPVTASTVSTACSNSPSCSDTASNTKAGNPSIAVAALP
jgi:hypothetical protein